MTLTRIILLPCTTISSANKAWATTSANITKQTVWSSSWGEFTTQSRNVNGENHENFAKILIRQQKQTSESLWKFQRNFAFECISVYDNFARGDDMEINITTIVETI